MNKLLLMMLIAGSVQAQENCGFPVSLTKSGFEAGEQPVFVVLPPENTPVTLNVISPTEGQIIPLDRLQVYGTLTGPSNTGVVVARQLAWSNASDFSSRPIVLTPGAQAITVTATTLDGLTQTVIRNITVTPSIGADVTLRASQTGGYAPVGVQFQLATRLPALQTTISRVQIDYQGDGVFDTDSTAVPSNLSFNYDTAGAYIALARVSFDDSNPVTPLVVKDALYRIHVQTLAYARQTLCGVYFLMKSRLAASQIPLALNSLNPSIRPRFQSMWTLIGNDLPNVAAKLGPIATGQISDVSAELTMALPDPDRPGAFLGYPLLFTRGDDGVWRIYKM